MSLIYISLEEILRLHYQIIKDFGGSHGVRDEGRLKSVVEAPKQEAFGNQQYPTVYEKAAVYLRNIIGDHPFVDGNKRSALTVCGLFLARNSCNLIVKPKELEDFVIKVSVKHLGIPEIASWLNKNTEKVA
jgi:death-on-curing protein